MIPLFLLIPALVHSKNFLLVSMDQGRSHAGSFAPLMNRLQLQNHSVSLYFNTFEPEIDYGMKNELIDLSEVASSPVGVDSVFFAIVWGTEFSFVHQAAAFLMQSLSCRVVLERRRQEFDRLAKGKWDLIFADSLFAVCGYGIAELNDGHHVMMHSTDIEGAHSTAKAFHRNYGLLPPSLMSYASGWRGPSYFIDRVKSSGDWLGSLVATNVLGSFFMRIALSPTVKSFSYPEFCRTSTFSFTDMPESLYPPAPRTNDYYSYGSYCNESSKLPKDIYDFVSDPLSRGTIVVAFGTLLPWDAAPKSKLGAFVDALNSFTNYRVIWSYNGGPIKIANHVKLLKWIPQNDLLLHSKTVLFISHGGLKSVKEAACSGTPSLFMPMFAEQMRNAWLAKNRGYGEILNKFLLTSDYMAEKIRKILSEPNYKLRARIMKEELLDRPLSTLDHATFLVNRLMKYEGKFPEFFYPRSLHLSYLSTLNVDVLLLASAVLLIISQ